MKNHHFAILLRAIKKEFPMEPPGVYYVSPISSKTSPTGKCIPARGKIYQKIRNSRSNTENSRKRKRDDPAYVFQQKEALEKLKDSHREDLDWLNSHSSPWKTVLEKWRKTYDVRKNSTYATVSEFLEEWTIFNNSKSVELIALDFSIMYPDKGTDFHRKWEIFYEKLKIIRADKYASERLKKVLKDLQPIVNSEEFQDSRMLLEFKIVAMLVAPKARASKKIKYSTQESIDSIIRFADSAADIEEVKKTQRGRAKMIKDTVQPYIIIQGNIQNIDQILIVIDEIKYEFQSIIEAFDCLFKLFHVFQVKYPKAGYHLHLLIQRTVYKIETPYDLIPQNITDIVTEFERST